MQKYIGLNLKKINTKLGHRKAEHSFYHSSTQWDLPTLETYNELIKHFNINKWEQFKEYEELRKEYEELRRPFNPIEEYKMNVLRVSQEGHITGKYDHDTVKPEKLTRILINTCSRKNDLVVVPFAGSGTECAMAVKEQRNCIGFDIESKYVEMSNDRINVILREPELKLI